MHFGVEVHWEWGNYIGEHNWDHVEEVGRIGEVGQGQKWAKAEQLQRMDSNIFCLNC
jgi:hypothetical protein